MQQILDFLAEFNVWTVIIRTALAIIMGGVIGLERGKQGRAAGMRTHILVCLGAALTAMIGFYLYYGLGVSTDPMRISAQVISGIGFLGVGTIMLKGRFQITGLTTAAGLWATAAIGLSVGYGLYEAAFATVFVVMIAFTWVSSVEHRITRKRHRLFIYLEIDHVDSIRHMTEVLTSDFGAVEIQVTPPRSGRAPHVGMEALITIPPKVTVEEKIKRLHKLNHVVFALYIN